MYSVVASPRNRAEKRLSSALMDSRPPEKKKERVCVSVSLLAFDQGSGHEEIHGMPSEGQATGR